MQDRFRFRVWNKKNKEMIYNAEIAYDGMNYNTSWKIGKNTNDGWVDCFGYYLDYPEDYEIMQCTGLKDKNGKLIFEGDILQSEEYPFKNEKGYNYVAEVLWDDASATFYYYTFRISNNVVGRSTGNTGELNEYEDWKVIGNIYENKELLENE